MTNDNACFDGWKLCMQVFMQTYPPRAVFPSSVPKNSKFVHTELMWFESNKVKYVHCYFSRRHYCTIQNGAYRQRIKNDIRCKLCAASGFSSFLLRVWKRELNLPRFCRLKQEKRPPSCNRYAFVASSDRLEVSVQCNVYTWGQNASSCFFFQNGVKLFGCLKMWLPFLCFLRTKYEGRENVKYLQMLVPNLFRLCSKMRWWSVSYIGREDYKCDWLQESNLVFTILSTCTVIPPQNSHSFGLKLVQYLYKMTFTRGAKMCLLYG